MGACVYAYVHGACIHCLYMVLACVVLVCVMHAFWSVCASMWAFVCMLVSVCVLLHVCIGVYLHVAAHVVVRLFMLERA